VSVARPAAASEAAASGALAAGDGAGEFEYLLVKRRNPPGAGTWSLPGGKIRLGERVLEAGQREVFEETGIPAAALDWLAETAGYNDVIFPRAKKNNSSSSRSREAAADDDNNNDDDDDNDDDVDHNGKLGDAAPAPKFHFVLTQLIALAPAEVETQAGDDAAALRWETTARLASGDVEMVGFDVVEHLTRVDGILTRRRR
jgi:8-oxo-dGTP pyrophosphatase MutT (NUDIX family)